MIFPFTHGLEIEHFIVRKNGEIVTGDLLIKVWEHLFKKASESLIALKENAPPEIRRKIRDIWIEETERHGKIIKYVRIDYKVNTGSVEVNMFGPDPNISQITWLLELATPPAESLKELKFWTKILQVVARRSLPSGYGIMSIGFNPTFEEYISGVTCGEHHHIGIQNKGIKIAAYNLIRAYIPHLIALSVNSPFVKRRPIGEVIVKREGHKIRVLSRETIKSIRLAENRGQLGPEIPQYLPYLRPTMSRYEFAKLVMRVPPDDRYVDIFPFTEYGTIEIRVFDSQFWDDLRFALVVLVQLLALKAKKMYQHGEEIPNVNGRILRENRNSAINFGLHGKFFPDESLPKKFIEVYNYDPNGMPNKKLFNAVQSMLVFLAEEIKELGIREELDIILAEIYGSKQLLPPITPADYLLLLYYMHRNSVKEIINGLITNTVGKIGLPEIKLEQALVCMRKPIKVETRKTLTAKLSREVKKKLKLRRKIEKPKILQQRVKELPPARREKKAPRIIPSVTKPSLKPSSIKISTQKLIITPTVEEKKKQEKLLVKSRTPISKPTTIKIEKPISRERITATGAMLLSIAPRKIDFFRKLPEKDVTRKGTSMKVIAPKVVNRFGVVIVKIEGNLKSKVKVYAIFIKEGKIHSAFYREKDVKNGKSVALAVPFEVDYGDYQLRIFAMDRQDMIGVSSTILSSKDLTKKGLPQDFLRIEFMESGVGRSSLELSFNAMKNMKGQLLIFILEQTAAKVYDEKTKVGRRKIELGIPLSFTPEYDLVALFKCKDGTFFDLKRVRTEPYNILLELDIGGMTRKPIIYEKDRWFLAAKIKSDKEGFISTIEAIANYVRTDYRGHKEIERTVLKRLKVDALIGPTKPFFERICEWKVPKIGRKFKKLDAIIEIHLYDKFGEIPLRNNKFKFTIHRK